MRDSDWEILDALYHSQNITKAAAALYMTQPSLTKRLQRIEQEWGVQLMLRGKGGVVFTPEGERLAQEAEKMLAYMKNLKDEVGGISAGKAGTVHIGVSNSFLRYRMPTFLQEYGERRPGVSFDIQTLPSNEILEMVENNLLHMGIVSGDPPFGGKKILVSVDQAYAISKNPLRFEDLPSTPRVQNKLAPVSQRFFEDWWAEFYDQPPLIGMNVNHSDTCYDMVSLGLGYSIHILPPQAVGMVELSKLPLHHRDGTPLTRNTWAICKEELCGVALVRDWMGFLEEVSGRRE